MKQILATVTLDDHENIVSYHSHGAMTYEEFKVFSEDALSLMAKRKAYENAVFNNEIKLDLIGGYLSRTGCFRENGMIDFEPALRPVFEKFIIEWEGRKTLIGQMKTLISNKKKQVFSFFVNLGLSRVTTYFGKKGVNHVKS